MEAKKSQKSGEADRFLRRPEVCKLTGLSVSSLYEMMSKGNFPKNVCISKRLVVWSEREVNSWMAARIASRDKMGRA